jgi:hypothetical protein
MDWIKGLLNENFIATIIVIVVAFNGILTALKVFLEKIKDLTKTSLDNKLYAIVSKLTGWIAWLIDLVTANKEHK